MMWINVENFFRAALWVVFTAMWGWMIYLFCTGTTIVGFAGLLGMCLISITYAVVHFISTFREDYYDEE